MHQDNIKNLLKERADHVKVLAGNIVPEFAPDDIHKFRVEIKKLRAFLRMLTTAPHQPAISIPKKVKQLYDITGIVRDSQLQEKQLGSFDIPSYHAHIASTIAKQKREWDIHYTEKTFSRLNEKLAGHHFHKLKKTALQDFIHNYMADVRAIILFKPDDNDIHTIRKHVKDILYNIKCAEEEWPEALQELETFPVKKLDPLSNMIGNYHDAYVMHDRLQKYAAGLADGKEKTILQRIIRQEEEKLSKVKPVLLKKVHLIIKAATGH